MELLLLGTSGGPRPLAHRGAPSQAILHNGGIYLVDCGNGVARQMVRASLDFADLRAVFLTHHHADHMLDIGALPYLAWIEGLSDPVELIGPPPLRAVLNHFLAMIEVDLTARQQTTGRPNFADLLRIREVAEPGLLSDADGLTVSCCVVDHPPIRPSFAYRFETAERSIVISGDTRYSPALVDLARGADVLVHEAYHRPTVDGGQPRPANAETIAEHIRACHTEVCDAGRVAQEAQVGMLVLSHLVPADAAISEDTWLAPARSAFRGVVALGRDMQVI